MTPPRSTFSGEDIVNAAYWILEHEGWDAVTVRTIAIKLNSSTMPIYSYMKSMNKLEEELRKRVFNEIVQYQLVKYTDDIFLNIAIGYVFFAREKRNLFNFYFIERAKETPGKEQERMHREVLKHYGGSELLKKRLDNVPERAMKNISLKSWIFTHGLAVLVSSGMLKDLGNEKIKDLLLENGAAVFTWETNYKNVQNMKEDIPMKKGGSRK